MSWSEIVEAAALLREGGKGEVLELSRCARARSSRRRRATHPVPGVRG